jgi:predicted kinase
MDHKKFNPMLDSFLEFASKKLELETVPKINYKADQDTSFGGYNPSTNEIQVTTLNRHPMDIFRTVAHELQHHKQNLQGRIQDVAKEGSTGSDIENEANAEAGKILRWFAQSHPDYFKMVSVNEEVVEEGLNDPATHRAVFMAGGPASGKDYVMKKTLQGHGLTEINTDVALEYLMKKHKLDLAMPDTEEKERNVARGRAKNITHEKQRLALQGRKGLIINGTASEHENIRDMKKSLEDKGYKTMMVFVHTSNEVSKERNALRNKVEGGRKVPEDVRAAKWQGAQEAKEHFKKMFGDKFIHIDNSHDYRTANQDKREEIDRTHKQTYKAVHKFVASPPSPTETDWRFKEMEKRKIAAFKPIKTYNKTLPIHHGRAIQECEIDPAKREEGTDSVVAVYANMTPGQAQTFKRRKVPKSVQEWASKNETIDRFKEKYGDQYLTKLNEAVRRLSESDDKGAFDMSPIENSGKDEILGKESTIKTLRRKSKNDK